MRRTFPQRFALTALIFLVCVLSTLASTSSITAAGSRAAQTQATDDPPPPLLDTPMGAVESFYRPQDAADAGVGFERIIFEWRYFQPNSEDDWQTWSVPDSWLSTARRDGRMVVGLLKNAPNWATGSTLLGAVPLGLDYSIDDKRNLWANFVKKIVTYYGPKWNIHHWIIYNEPDIRPQNTTDFEFAGSVDDYYKLVKVAYKTAHANDPQAVIHLAGFTYWQDVVHNRSLYLERFVRTATNDPEGRKNGLFFDVLSVHVFETTDNVWYITQLFKQLLGEAGVTKPIWVDEMNALPTVDSGWPLQNYGIPVSLDQQAAFIIQGSALAMAAGADHVEVYRLYDNEVHDGYEAWGLVRNDGTHRPGFFALKTASTYFRDSTSVQRFKTAFATMVVFAQNGRTVYVAWNRTRHTPMTLHVRASDPASTDAKFVSMIGDEQTIAPGEVKEASYSADLPPCEQSCDVQGDPVILVQPGEPQPGWVVDSSGQVAILSNQPDTTATMEP
ncbi:MAG TPA: hypothetical protein VKQ72_05305 [Aggregatilineales bacterium]|nr:hypothetical protein [Aggregatilineales bacterium]